MDEPHRKWRISIRAALGVVLGLCVGMALIRGADAVGGIVVAVAGAAVLVGTLGALAATLIGREPRTGFVWGLMITVMGAIITSWLAAIY